MDGICKREPPLQFVINLKIVVSVKQCALVFLEANNTDFIRASEFNEAPLWPVSCLSLQSQVQ